jgi:transcriptional regulator with XRE-family HTH domain
MTAAELRTARQALHLSLDALAARLSLTPAVVRAFEDGRLAIPERYARLVEWLVAAHEREEALVARGLAACPLVEQWRAEPEATGGRARAARTRALADHMRGCARCRERQQSVSLLLPPIPLAVLSPAERAFVRLVRRVERLPRWARPVAYGGAIAGVAALLRAVMALG